jgi:hypothetical protein
MVGLNIFYSEEKDWAWHKERQALLYYHFLASSPVRHHISQYRVLF